MEALRVVLNETNTDTIQNAEKIEQQIKNINRIKEKIEYFVFDIMLVDYIQEHGILGISCDDKQIEQKICEMILEKNNQRKQK